MNWEDDILAAMEPTKGSRKRNLDSDSDYQDKISDGEISEEDLEWKEAQTWNKKDLMGNEKDRKRLFAMSELEREMELSERKKKLDQLEEKMILKQKLKQKSFENLTESERKKQSFDNLRKMREKKGKPNQPTTNKKYRGYSSDSDQSDYYDEKPKKEEFIMSLEDALAIQITRDQVEKWLHKPMFHKALKGTLIRLSLGNSSGEPVYRCCMISDTPEYHRKYKLNKSITKLCMNITHGKASKQALFDMVSNQPITQKEWTRYEMTCKTEKISLPTKQAIKRKKEDLKEIKEHVFTEDEITNMIQKKRELNIVGNTTMEHFRLQNELEAAKFTGDQDKIEELEKQIEELDSLHEPSRTASADLIARLNAKNKEKDLQEGQKAELKALVIKRKQGVSESDPFARRKTQPVHIISDVNEKEQVFEDSEISKSLSASGQKSAEVVDSEGDDPFDDIDISILEQEINL